MNLITPTLGDGDCFYYTLCQGLTALNYTPTYTPATLRAAVTTEMSNNPRRYPPPHNFTRSQYINASPYRNANNFRRATHQPKKTTTDMQPHLACMQTNVTVRPSNTSFLTSA